MNLPPPPKLDTIYYGAQLNAGMGKSTVIADMDFETYSPAGFVWSDEHECWRNPKGARQKGLTVVGTSVYVEHPEAEVLCLAYDLKDAKGRILWTPDSPSLPYDLFNHLKIGGLVEAWNSIFEFFVWNSICVKKYGFPPLKLDSIRDAAAKARAFSLPGGLEKCGQVLNTKNQKDKEGKRLLEKFSWPRNPTKNDLRKQIFTTGYGLRPEDIEDVSKLYSYCVQDIATEAEISSKIPDLNDFELEFWKADQAINLRGVQIDLDLIRDCEFLIEKAYEKYNEELSDITNGDVYSASQVPALKEWMAQQGVETTSLAKESIETLLRNDSLPVDVRRALMIRSELGVASVKKLYAMLNQVSKDGRLRNLYVYHQARTGRAAGQGPQPQNIPKSGPNYLECANCQVISIKNPSKKCANCETLITDPTCIREWDINGAEAAIQILKIRSLEFVEYYWNDALKLVSACLRSMFIAAPGHDLICSDYSAIEAVVLAALAKEEWRLEVFKTHGKIYEMSASRITGIPFEEFEEYFTQYGYHHPARNKIGKVAELASGFGGWTGAWHRFGAGDHFGTNERALKDAILAWRDASPRIVEFWGGQFRYGRPLLFGLEGMAIAAILSPGQEFSHNGIIFVKKGETLYCKLLSGRYLTYHNARVAANPDPKRKGSLIYYKTWNTNPKTGPFGWIETSTYGGKLTENVVQATARDLFAFAIVNLEKKGYPIVLHSHDEAVAEVKKGFGSVEEFETTMNLKPNYAKNWPYKAKGGWRGERYRK